MTINLSLGNSTKHLNFDAMSPAQSRRYDEIVEELVEEFNALIGTMHEGNENNLAWLLSSIASRNPYQSELFERCCRLVYAREWVTHLDEEPGFILLSDYALCRKLRREFNDHGSLIIKYTGSLLQRLKDRVLPWLCLARNAVLLMQRLIFRYPRRTADWEERKPLILLDTFVYPDDVDGGRFLAGRYNDSLYPGLFANVPEAIKDQLVYLPTFIGMSWYWPVFREVRSVSSMLLMDDFLRITDYLTLFFSPLRKVEPFKCQLALRNFHLTALIQEEQHRRRADWSRILAEMNYCFVRRLKQSGVPLLSVLDWHENQVIDRGLTLGVRRFYPGVKVVGYQGWVMGYRTGCQIPIEHEVHAQLTPDSIAVIGKAQSNLLAMKTSIPVFLAPAFRYNYLWDDRQDQPDPNWFTVLVGLTCARDDALRMMDQVILVAKQLKNEQRIQFWVRPHPSNNFAWWQMRINSLELKNMRLVKGGVIESIEGCNLFLGEETSMCVEALVKGVFVVIIGNMQGITENPIPDHLAPDRWQICYGEAEIAEIIKTQAKSGFIKNEETAKEVCRDCFQEVTRDSVREFIEKLAPTESDWKELPNEVLIDE
ncbi:hypothetical protein OAK15_03570 [Verrucomicrobia bacterium]|nr:hypothetical protein [Verrucomicrobiota bacterium]